MDVDAVLDRRRLKRRLTIWRVVALVLVAVVVVILLSRGTGGSGPYIARVSVDGLIVDERDREQLFKSMAEQDDVKAVIVHIDSPGGTVVGSEMIYKGLREIGETKPVVAVISNVGASGGYITALGADRIYARENTLTGSIGVIFQAPEVSGMLEDLGITINEVKTSPVKGGPSLYAPMNDETRDALEDMVADAFDWFTGIVAERRGYSPDELEAVANGRVYSGRQAVKNGLIDALGGEDEALAWLETEKGISGNLPVRDREVKQEFSFLAGAMAWVTGDSDLGTRLSLDGLLALWQPSF